MVSWFVKAALLNIAGDTGVDPGAPASREDWARLMQRLGVKGIHIAERDTQRARAPPAMTQLWNTGSLERFIAERLQPAAPVRGPPAQEVREPPRRFAPRPRAPPQPRTR